MEKRVKVLDTTVNLQEAIEHVIANYEEAIKHLKDNCKSLSYNPFGRYHSYAKSYSKALKELAEKKEMKNMKCEKCIFWERGLPHVFGNVLSEGEIKDNGLCHRYPQTEVKHKDDYCGECQEKE